MKETTSDRRLEPPTMEEFKAFVRKIVSVPKKEIDKKEEDYRKRRKTKRENPSSRPEH